MHGKHKIFESSFSPSPTPLCHYLRNFYYPRLTHLIIYRLLVPRTKSAPALFVSRACIILRFINLLLVHSYPRVSRANNFRFLRTSIIFCLLLANSRSRTIVPRKYYATAKAAVELVSTCARYKIHVSISVPQRHRVFVRRSVCNQ